MKTIVVTGANGFIGSALCRELVANNYNVIALDREGCNNNLPDSELVTFVPFDLSETSKITPELKLLKPDTYIHLAWFGMNGNTRGDAQVQLQNSLWTLESLRQAKAIGCKKFVCAGSIMEYETFFASMQQENHLGANYMYGAAKLTARMTSMIEASKIGIDIVWAEITNAYGIGENSPRLINSTLRKILNGEALEFTEGLQNYDFVYIDDVARAFRLIAEKGKAFAHYLIGSSNAKPLKEFLVEIKNAIAQSREFVFGAIEYTGVNLPISIFDTKKTLEDTGFKSSISFQDGIKKTFEWIKNNN